MKHFRANGKLLLTGEYTVLRGALALAVPTRLGQTLKVLQAPDAKGLVWESYTVDGELWFSACFDQNLSLLETNDPLKAQNLKLILSVAKSLNPFWKFSGQLARTDLEFHRLWGLGSSSTLISLVAQWANIDAFELFFKTQTGSGYDVACALQDHPLVYKLHDQKPEVETVEFSPNFKADLGFVYLGQKQISEQEVTAFAELPVSKEQLDAISKITRQVVSANNLQSFESLLIAHEKLTGQILNRKPIKEQRFSDYPGAIKSLGAWGGDFVLATRFSTNRDYFRALGYTTCLSWEKMIGT